MRNFLADDGLICISIDNNEVENLRKICSEIFGEANYVAEIVVQNNPRGRQSDSFVATVHEYLLCYAKNAVNCVVHGMPLTKEQKEEYNFMDDIGAYRLLGLRQRGVASLREDRPDMFFPVYVNSKTLEISLDEHDGWEIVIPKKSDGREGRWMWGRPKCIAEIKKLVPSFDNNVTEETVMEIAKRHPFYAVFRDSGLANDSVAVNFEQIFETYSPKTRRKVL